MLRHPFLELSTARAPVADLAPWHQLDPSCNHHVRPQHLWEVLQRHPRAAGIQGSLKVFGFSQALLPFLLCSPGWCGNASLGKHYTSPLHSLMSKFQSKGSILLLPRTQAGGCLCVSHSACQSFTHTLLPCFIYNSHLSNLEVSLICDKDEEVGKRLVLPAFIFSVLLPTWRLLKIEAIHLASLFLSHNLPLLPGKAIVSCLKAKGKNKLEKITSQLMKHFMEKIYFWAEYFSLLFHESVILF